MLKFTKDEIMVLLEVERIYEWAKEYPYRFIGRKNNCFSCPVAMYLQHQGVPVFVVYGSTVGWINFNKDHHKSADYGILPHYTKELVKKVDIGIPSHNSESLLQTKTFLKRLEAVLEQKKQDKAKRWWVKDSER